MIIGFGMLYCADTKVDMKKMERFTGARLLPFPDTWKAILYSVISLDISIFYCIINIKVSKEVIKEHLNPAEKRFAFY